MSNAHFKLPGVYNEPVLNYAPGSPEKIALKKALKTFLILSGKIFSFSCGDAHRVLHKQASLQH